MSLIVQKFIICDGEYCDGRSSGVDSQTFTARRHRELAKDEGWTYRNGKDYCAKCSTERAKKSP